MKKHTKQSRFAPLMLFCMHLPVS